MTLENALVTLENALVTRKMRSRRWKTLLHAWEMFLSARNANWSAFLPWKIRKYLGKHLLQAGQNTSGLTARPPRGGRRRRKSAGDPREVAVYHHLWRPTFGDPREVVSGRVSKVFWWVAWRPGRVARRPGWVIGQRSFSGVGDALVSWCRPFLGETAKCFFVGKWSMNFSVRKQTN